MASRRKKAAAVQQLVPGWSFVKNQYARQGSLMAAGAFRGESGGSRASAAMIEVETGRVRIDRQSHS
jgi:hypothetical protein